METDFGRIVLLATDSSFQVYDLSLNFINSFKISSNNFYNPNNFELVEDGLIVSGEGIFKKFLWDGTDLYTEINDIGVVNVDLGDYVVEPYIAVWAGVNKDTLVRLRYLNPVITVRNYGETTVEQFYISTFFPIVYVGLYQFLTAYNGTVSIPVSGISIQPGEEKDITLLNLDIYFYNYPNGEIYNQCFTGSHPNNRIDDDYTNNTHCFDLAVSTDEEIEPDPTVSVSPNPSNGVLKIAVGDVQAKEASWVLYDQFGRRQFALPLNTWQSEYVVSLPHLLIGIYYWKVQTKEGLLNSGRLVIQH